MATKAKTDTDAAETVAIPPADTTVDTAAAPSGVDVHGWEPSDYHRLAADQGCAGDMPADTDR